MLGSIAILLMLVLLNGLFSAVEMALVSVNKNKVKINAEAGEKRAILLLKVLEEPSKFLSTIQIFISLIGLFSGAYAADTFSDPIVSLLVGTGMPVSPDVLRPITFFLITLVLSFFILIGGELVPKRLGMHHAQALSQGSAGFLNVLSKIAAPFVKLLSVSTNGILKLFGVGDRNEEDDVTEEEIRMLVESGSEHGSIAEAEHDMINNIFEFDNKTAEDACIHRVDVVALPVDASADEIIEMLSTVKYSRIPVYEENMDDICGILHMKDIMKHVLNHADLSKLNLRELLREPYFVPFSKKTDELFQEMQKKRVHMAVVIDEYGGTMGIVTMEDLVEEIMGSILDEHDEVELPDISAIDENTFSINGATDLEAVEDYFGVKLPTEDYDTLSGFLVGQLGHIPTEDEKPELEFNGLLFKVDSVQEKRIASITVCKI